VHLGDEVVREERDLEAAAGERALSSATNSPCPATTHPAIP
jgi:hypothetical protein